MGLPKIQLCPSSVAFPGLMQVALRCFIYEGCIVIRLALYAPKECKPVGYKQIELARAGRAAGDRFPIISG